jgi:hypothetical protein
MSRRLVFGGWSPDQTAWQAVSLVAATAAAVALTVFLRGTPAAELASRTLIVVGPATEIGPKRSPEIAVGWVVTLGVWC